MGKDSITFLDEGGVQAVIPKALYQAIVKVQAAGGLEWEDACVRTAELADHGSKKFKRDVEKEARRLHNSELMTQLNRGRSSIEASYSSDTNNSGSSKTFALKIK